MKTAPGLIVLSLGLLLVWWGLMRTGIIAPKYSTATGG